MFLFGLFLKYINSKNISFHDCPIMTFYTFQFCRHDAYWVTVTSLGMQVGGREAGSETKLVRRGHTSVSRGTMRP